jgi:hypothetical protein
MFIPPPPPPPPCGARGRAGRGGPPRPAVLQALAAGCAAPAAAAPIIDPLPSWNDGITKQGLIDFIAAAIGTGRAGFIPPEERIATFDNDGTLWPEKPIVQGAFMQQRLQALVARDPSLAARQPFKAALEGDTAYLEQAGEPALMEIVVATSTGMTDEAFEADVRAFFEAARHPRLGRPYTALTYRPMVELLDLLRANGFRTFLCSGGDADFMRAVSEQMYGIPRHQVIGSGVSKQLGRSKAAGGGGTVSVWRRPALAALNDKDGKPVAISAHIGRRPVLAAGNVRSGGDIAMLEYTGGNHRPSLKLLINHDDGAREFAYQESDGASLAAARRHHWTVVSMKRDWKVIFRDQPAPGAGGRASPP